LQEIKKCIDKITEPNLDHIMIITRTNDAKIIDYFLEKFREYIHICNYIRTCKSDGNSLLDMALNLNSIRPNSKQIYMIKKLLKYGAQLASPSQTAFHRALKHTGSDCNFLIKTLITHARFNCPKQDTQSEKNTETNYCTYLIRDCLIVGIFTSDIELHARNIDFDCSKQNKQSKEIKRRIIATFWALRELINRIPHDITQLILSKMLTTNLYDINKTWERSLNLNQIPPHILYIIMPQIAGIEELLQQTNLEGNTPLQHLIAKGRQDEGKIQPLLDGSRLQADLNQFIEEYPVPSDNLMLQICQNYINRMLENS